MRLKFHAITTFALAVLAATACDSVTGNCQTRRVVVQTGTLPGSGSNSEEIVALRAQGWDCTDDGPAVGANGAVIGKQYSCRKC